MTEKETQALLLIEEQLIKYERPIVLCSFGKDSLVVLDLVRQQDPDVPVLFFREAFQPRKYQFANAVIEMWGLEVYDYPPSFMDVVGDDETVELLSFYQAGEGHYIKLAIGCDNHFDPADYKCALDVIQKPKCRGYDYVWDLSFMGSRDEDRDPLAGPMTLAGEVAQLGATQLCFPLKGWTDRDIWDYTVRHRLPVHTARYDPQNQYRERADRTHNPDYLDICTNCLKTGPGETVACPKYGTHPRVGDAAYYQRQIAHWQSRIVHLDPSLKQKG